MQDLKAEMVYIGDPLCSWCWAFAPELSLLKEKYQHKLLFRILLGGLRPGTTGVMRVDQRQFLAKHWQEIQQLCGQDFNFGILESPDFIYDTEPPARAVRCIREINPALEFDFFKAVQKAFYVENRNTNLPETYLSICEDFFLETAKFERLFFSKELRDLTSEDFEQSRMLGITGFPTVLIKPGQKYKALTRGFERFETMDQKLQQLLEKSI